MNAYFKSFGDFENSKGLYFLFKPDAINLRKTVIKTWEQEIASDAYQILTPLIVPSDVLTKSGHHEAFGDELFHLSGHSGCLRPETAQSVFPNLKCLRKNLRGSPLKLHQVGRSFRSEKTTRTGRFRRLEFEQMELHVLHQGPTLFDQYLEKVARFFERLKVPIFLEEVTKEDLPHYAKRTVDVMYRLNESEWVQLGSINDRGSHDLYQFSESERRKLSVFEISLGLDRIVETMHALTL